MCASPSLWSKLLRQLFLTETVCAAKVLMNGGQRRSMPICSPYLLRPLRTHRQAHSDISASHPELIPPELMCTPMPRSMRSTTTPSLSKTKVVRPDRGDGKFTRPGRANRCCNLNFSKRCLKRPEQARRHWQNSGPGEPVDCCWPPADKPTSAKNVRFQEVQMG